MLRFKSKLFEIIVYIFVIITGIGLLISHLGTNRAIGWIIITLGVLNLGATLLKKKK